MNKETQSILVGLLGGLLISITASGRFTSYVKPGFAPLLMTAGIVLVLVAVLSLIQAIRSEMRATRAAEAAAVGGPPGASVAAAPEGDHGHAAGAPVAVDVQGADPAAVDAHGHEHTASRAPWLLLVPVLVLLLVAPTALGADAVSRNAGSQGLAGLDVAAPAPVADKSGVTGDGGYKPNDGTGRSNGTAASTRRTMQFPALPAGQNPQVTLKDFVLRALYDGENSVAVSPVTVTGFIAPAGDGEKGGYTIARMVISCCAADASALRIHVAGDAPLPQNTWVTAVVQADPGTGTLANDYVPTVTVHSMTQTGQPSDPYEH